MSMHERFQRMRAYFATVTDAQFEQAMRTAGMEEIDDCTESGWQMSEPWERIEEGELLHRQLLTDDDVIIEAKTQLKRCVTTANLAQDDVCSIIRVIAQTLTDNYAASPGITRLEEILHDEWADMMAHEQQGTV